MPLLGKLLVAGVGLDIQSFILHGGGLSIAPGIISNLVFSQREKSFANHLATAAAIDGIMHHSVIREFDLSTYRTSEAQERQLQTTITPDPEWQG